MKDFRRRNFLQTLGVSVAAAPNIASAEDRRATVATDHSKGCLPSTAIKEPCRVATTDNIQLSGLQNIDGMDVLAGNRVLVKSQKNKIENGVWVAETGAWHRSEDFSRTRDVVRGTIIAIAEGDANAGLLVHLTSNVRTVGNDPISFESLVLQPGASSDELAFRGPNPNEVPSTVYLNLIEIYNVARWGVDVDRPGSENMLLIQNAINSMTRSELILPDGETRINGKIVIPPGNMTHLTGRGVGPTEIVQEDLRSGLFKFDINYAQGGGLRGARLRSTAEQGAAGSTGISIEVISCNDNFNLSELEIYGFDKGIQHSGGYYPVVDKFTIMGFRDFAIRLAPKGVGTTEIAGSSWSQGKISNYGFSGDARNSVGLLIEQGSGEFFSTIDITATGRAVVVKPPTGSWARFMFFETVLADSSLFEGWTFDGSDAPVLSNSVSQCWAASSGGGAYRPIDPETSKTSERGAGILTLGQYLDGLRWSDGFIRDNDCGGWEHRGGKNVVLRGNEINYNSRRIGYERVYPGASIKANVQDWSFDDNRVGNFAMGVFPNATQGAGLHIDAGDSRNSTIRNNNFVTPGAGHAGIENGDTSETIVIEGNAPLSIQGLNNSKAREISFLGGSAIHGGTSGWIGPFGLTENESDALFVIGKPCVLSQLYFASDVAPGLGSNYTLRLRKNGVDTAVSVAIIDKALNATINTPLTFSAGDYFSMRIQTSPLSAPCRLRGVACYEGYSAMSP